MSSASDFVIENGVLKKYVGPGGDVVIPEGVTSISSESFRKNSRLMSVQIPEGVAFIGRKAFFDCGGLTDVTIPESVISIGDGAFSNCSHLSNLILPEHEIQISTSAFSGCPELKDADGFVIVKEILYSYHGAGEEATIPEGVRIVGNDAFKSCDGLVSVTIPESVTSIGSGAFYGCSRLTNVMIPEGVKIIDRNTFALCKSLLSVTIRKGVASIEEKAFFGCSNLINVTIPEGVTKIGDWAFFDCCNLSSVMIPDSVTSIGEQAFVGCCITRLRLPAGLNRLEPKQFAAYKTLYSVTLSESMSEAHLVTTFPKKTLIRQRVQNCEAVRSKSFVGAVAYALDDGKRIVYAGKGTSLIYGGWGFLGHNMTDYGTDGFSWDTYDRNIIENGPDYPMNEATRLCAALYRLLDPEQLSENHRDALIGIVAEKPEAVLRLAEDEQDPEMLRLLFRIGAVDKSKKTLMKKIVGSVVSKIAAVALEDFAGAGASADPVSKKKTDAPRKELSPAGKRVAEFMKKEGMTEVQLDKMVNRLYGYRLVTKKELGKDDIPGVPELIGNAGTPVEPIVPAWMIVAHEAEGEANAQRRDRVVAAWPHPGVRPEAEEILAMLDHNSLQQALLILSDRQHIYCSSFNKAWALSYPICRYADEKTMAELCRRAEKLCSKTAGDEASGAWIFRRAALYSNTRAAMMYAEKHKDLEDYAALRSTTAETLRNTAMAEFGLNERGEREYDLGPGRLSVRLNKDMKLDIFDHTANRIVKSVPKKNADPEKYEAAKADIEDMERNICKVVKSRKDHLLQAFLNKTEFDAELWETGYLKNPVLKGVARMLVWCQEGKTFTVAETGAIDSNGQPYRITDAAILVAHPMEMSATEITAWQKYIAANGLKQPFLQVWEPVRQAREIKLDRYKGCMIPFYRFLDQEKHGITVKRSGFDSDPQIVFADCFADVSCRKARMNVNSVQQEYEIKSFSFRFGGYDRQVNHIVAYLDRITVIGRVQRDDLSIMELMDDFTLAQITEFIAAAQEANANNVLAALLDYKNKHFADFDPMAEFTLEW